MKICIPTTKDENQNYIINKDFETTTNYIIHNTKHSTSTIFSESDLMTEFNSENSLEALVNAGVSSIITPIIRSAAFVILKNRTDIQVFTPITTCIKETLDLFLNNKLKELTSDGLEFSMGCAGECGSCSSTTCK